MNEKHKFKNQEKPIIHIIKITNPNKNKPNDNNNNNKDSTKIEKKQNENVKKKYKKKLFNKGQENNRKGKQGRWELTAGKRVSSFFLMLVVVKKKKVKTKPCGFIKGE